MTSDVSFEISKLLKEKGFGDMIKSYDGSGMEVNVSLAIRKHVPTQMFFPRPTIAEVVMWLYEKYEIWINPIPRLSSWVFTIQEVKTGNNESLIDIDFYETNEYLISKDVPTIMSSPREAYKAAIKHILTNIL